VPRDQVFISYSHKDKKWRDELDTQLKPYVRDGSIISWSDPQIAPGSQWFTEIQSALANTKVAVLLVTPYFLASDFIHKHELGPLLKQAEQGGVKILWVPIRDSAYKQTALNNYQAALSPGTPLAAMTTAKRDRAWVDICEVIQSALIAPLKQSPKDDVPDRDVPPKREMPFGAILISAVLEDLDAAKVLRAALDQAGIIVWFDIERLKAGKDVRSESRENVERCSFCVPIVSANTKKSEGYFRLEWHYANERAMSFAPGEPFILPVVIDDTRLEDANVPSHFTTLMWTRCPNGRPPQSFVERLRELFNKRHRNAVDSRP
jgi:hypothetical protein